MAAEHRRRRACAHTFAARASTRWPKRRARADAHAAVAFDVCHPGLALRAVLLVQAVVFIGALVAAEPGDGVVAAAGGRRASPASTGALLWLVVVCALGPVMRRLRTAARASTALALGAGAALLGCLPLWALELIAAPQPAQGLGVALAGAGLAALLWAWLDLRARIWAPVDARVRLAELQSRIRPHFLFNALNTALALVRVDPAQRRAGAGGPGAALSRGARRCRHRRVAGRRDRAGARLPGHRAGALRPPLAGALGDRRRGAGARACRR